MQRSYLKLLLSSIFVICFMTACTNEDEQEKEKHFLQKVAETLSESSNIRLSSVTDFDWDEVCLFQNDDSEAYAAYDEYKKYSDTYGKEQIQFERAPYTNIFAFSKGGAQIQLYGFIAPKVRYKEKDIFLSVEGLYPNEDQTMQCLNNEETYLDLGKDGQYLYVIQKGNK